MPINTPYVGLQTSSIMRVLYLQAGTGIALVQDLVAGTLTVTNSTVLGAALTKVDDTNPTQDSIDVIDTLEFLGTAEKRNDGS